MWPTSESLQSFLKEAKPYAEVYAAKLVGLALGMALTVASARMLQAVGRGEFATVMAGVVIGVQLLNFGLSSSLLLLFSEEPGRITRYLWHFWGFAVVCCLGLAAVGFSLNQLAGSTLGALTRWWPFLALWIPIQLLGLFQMAALQAVRASQAISGLEIGGKFSVVILGFFSLLLFRGNVESFLSALLISDILLAVAGAVILYRRPIEREKTAPLPTREFGRRAFRIGLRAYPLLLLPHILIKADLFLVRAYRGAAETGVYSIASQSVDIALILPVTIAGLGLATIVRSSDRFEATLKLFRPVLYLTSAGALLVSPFVKPLVLLLFDEPYLEAATTILILLPGFVFFSLTAILSQYYASKGFPLIQTVWWLFGTVINIVLNIVFIPQYGMLAAAVTSSLSYGIVFLFSCGRFLKESELSLRSLFIPTRRVAAS